MEPGGRDSRFNLGYSMNLLTGETSPEIYGGTNLVRPSTSLQQMSPRHTILPNTCGSRSIKSDLCYDDRSISTQRLADVCTGNDLGDDVYGGVQPKKSPPSNGKKTKGRVKIKMEYIENKLRRYTTFSKRKTGIMKKAYELSTLTGTQVMLLVASETGHVYTFATRKLQPMITSEAGKALIQTCLNSPDPPAGSTTGDQRMSATGFEETELTYNISDDDSKEDNTMDGDSSGSSDGEADDYPSEVVFMPTASNSKPRPKDAINVPDIQDRKPSISNHNSSQSTAIASKAAQLISSTSQPHPTSTTFISNTPITSISISSPSTTSLVTTTTESIRSSVAQTPIMRTSLLYPTSQGMVYATPSNGRMIFSIEQQSEGSTAQPAQFITIPLSVVNSSTNQNELDLSKRK